MAKHNLVNKIRGSLRIISNSEQAFKNRVEAGQFLAKELKELSGKGTVVLGIPRGGVVIASVIAQNIGAELDIHISRKIGAPGNPELAIGSVSEEGVVYINEKLAQVVGAGSSYIEEEKKRQFEEIKRRSAEYRRARPKVALEGKVVVVTDDGVATGATMQAALTSIRQEKPKRIIAAIPVGSRDSLLNLAGHADEIICLRQPDYFGAVGQFYIEFPQVSDLDVRQILRDNYQKPNGSSGS